VEDNSVITPWEVTGEIDYGRLIERFGTTRLTPELLERIGGHTGRLHFMLRRGVFYSHRDLDLVLDSYEENGRFVLYTGRGPSGPVHLGHLIPWMFTKHLQDKFGSKLLFQFTDDERMLLRDDMDESITRHWVYQNALDLMALGFDPDKTEFIVNTRQAVPHCVEDRPEGHLQHRQVRIWVQGRSEHGNHVLPIHPVRPMFSGVRENWRACAMPYPGGNRSGPILAYHKRCCIEAWVS
jgi:hypothetical protein